MKKRANPEPITGVHLWLVLWRASRAVEASAVRSIESLQMCLSDFAVLEALLHKGPLGVNALGGKVLLTSGSITTAVDRLERRRLVERRGDGRDRRARIVHLTPAGRRLIRRAFAGHARDMESSAAALSARERSTLAKLLRKWGQDAEENKEGKS